MSQTVSTAADVSVSATNVEESGASDTRSLPLFFLVFILVGFASGVVLTLTFSPVTFGIGEFVGSCLAFGSVGASAGLLAAGSYDVIFTGRLEESNNLE